MLLQLRNLLDLISDYSKVSRYTSNMQTSVNTLCARSKHAKREMRKTAPFVTASSVRAGEKDSERGKHTLFQREELLWNIVLCVALIG